MNAMTPSVAGPLPPQAGRPAARPGRSRWALALLPALLAACGTLAPPHERPAAPVAAQFPGETGTPPAAGTPAASDLAWQRFFDEPRLQGLVELALAHNRDLRVAVLNIEAAQAQAGLQRAALFPSVGVGLTTNRQPNTNGDQSSTYTAGAQVSWEIDLFGRLRSLRDAALANVLSTEEVRKATQISLVAAVAQADLALRADDELLGLTRRTLATREDSQRLTQLMFDNGAASELDLHQAVSLVQAARATLAQLQRQRALDENALVLLIGQPLPDDLPVARTLDDQLVGTELPAGLPSDLLIRRPDILSAEQQLAAAEANIGAARAAFFPSISLTGSAGAASTHLSDLFNHGRFAWTLGSQLLAPVFDGGRNRSNLEAARANQQIAVAQYEKAIQTAFREVADALAGRATLDEQSRAQQALIESEASRLRLADLRYRNGVSSYLDLLDAQRSLFSAEQTGVQTRLARLQNRIELYKVLGGGWSQAETALAAGSPPVVEAASR